MQWNANLFYGALVLCFFVAFLLAIYGARKNTTQLVKYLRVLSINNE